LRARLAPLAVLLFVAQLAAPARGALFDDDEARRRIDDLKTRVDQVERTLAQRLDALGAPLVAAAEHHRAAVLGRERVDRADGRDAERLARPRERIERIVRMQILRLLARIDADRVVGAQQVVGQQQPVEDREQPVVAGDLLVHLAAPDQRVDPLGRVTLEWISATVAAEVRREALAEARELLGAHEVLDDGHPVGLEAGHVGFEIEPCRQPPLGLEVFGHDLSPLGSTDPSRSIASISATSAS